MCNAHNHSANCTCGFGGEGHLGRNFGSSVYGVNQGVLQRSSTNNSINNGVQYHWLKPLTNIFESYVNPNASCPICGAQVFFYMSPNGGRVFFDELGPPWPKHPCTDGFSVPLKPSVSSRIKLVEKAATYSWHKKGWEPFFVSKVKRTNKHLLQVSGYTSAINIDFSVDCINKNKKYVNKRNNNELITTKSIVFIRQITTTSFKLSILTTFGTVAFLNASAILSTQRKSKKDNVQTLKPNKKTPKNKTMEIAFNNAIKKSSDV